ncbi:MAG TPA: hypothetical protein VKJ65_03960, partial [Phycisphaerae bacterium]|nr:hypothetical protein [Phycisphaerae bacterium]
TLRVQPPDAAKHFVEKTGFGCSHWMKSGFQRDNLAQIGNSSSQMKVFCGTTNNQNQSGKK